jgi:hypothetical protein
MAKWSVYDEEEDMINETDIDAFARNSDFNWFQSECQKTAIYPKQQGQPERLRLPADDRNWFLRQSAPGAP